MSNNENAMDDVDKGQGKSGTGPADTQQKEGGRKQNQAKHDGRVMSGLKKAGRITYKVSALDVLMKDSKRLKPRFPHLWRDIFSGRWRDIDRRTTSKEKSNPLVTAAICGSITLALVVYTIVVAGSMKDNHTFNIFTIGGLVAVITAGVFQTMVYGYIAHIQDKRLKAAASKTTPPRTKKKGTPR